MRYVSSQRLMFILCASLKWCICLCCGLTSADSECPPSELPRTIKISQGADDVCESTYAETFVQRNRQAVQAIYELKPMADSTKVPGPNDLGSFVS